MTTLVEHPPSLFDSMSNTSLTRLQKERLKRKQRKKRKQEKKKLQTNPTKKEQPPTTQTKQDEQQNSSSTQIGDDKSNEQSAQDENEDDVEIEYIATNPFENIDPEEEENYESLREVFYKFNLNQAQVVTTQNANEQKSAKEEEKPQEKLSKKRRKLQRRLPIAVLKQLVSRPDLVEIHDTCAADPFLLLQLKSYHNTVPVPRHWSQKRKYLQGKRGIEKPPFELPAFIKKTGIQEVRTAGLEKDAEKTLKQKQREKLNPSMGKLDIEYQILHDAFFKYQTKPKMTGYGDLYYEGKEYEVEMKEKRPGVLSKELKEALGMPEGAPPPWLINMQRIGPPPSYPHLKIPGLNAPIPPGAEYGYHPGGWGRPPVDENGRPLYGDAYGEEEEAPRPQYVEITHWGQLPHEEFSEEEQEDQTKIDNGEASEEESSESVAVAGEEETSGFVTPVTEAEGLKTPETLNLRKRKSKGGDDQQLYQVLEQKEVSVGKALYGSDHQYIIDKAKKPKIADRVELMKSQKTESIDFALDPSELTTLTEEGLKKRFDKAIQEKKEKESRKDEGESGRKRKRTFSEGSNKKSKKYKGDFKF